MFIAFVGTSLLFGLVHMGNPNATLISGLNVAFAGILLGWAYILTGELAMPLGLHFAWGVFEEFVFGFANSGIKPLTYLFGSQVHGPKLWTGGSFGPEAGLLVTVLIVVDVLLIVAWMKLGHRWQGLRGGLAE